MTLETLYAIVSERKQTKPPGSYITYLLEKQPSDISTNVGKAGLDLMANCLSQNPEALVEIVTNLLFQLTVLLVMQEISPEEIKQEIDNRFMTPNRRRVPKD